MMDITAVLALIGCLSLLAGLIGGGIEAKEVKIPPLPRWSRFLSAALGIVLISLAVWLTYLKMVPPSPAADNPAPVAPSAAALLPTNTPAAVKLDLHVESIDGCTVKVNGIMRGMTGPLKWDWGDGIVSEGYFPQEHTYPRSAQYALTATDGSVITKTVTYVLNCPTAETAAIVGAVTNSPDPAKVYRLFAVFSGLVLDVSYGSMNAEARVVQYPWHEWVHQMWRFEPLAGDDQGYYHIRSFKSDLCLEVRAASLENQAEIIQNTCGDADHQKWKVVASENGAVVIWVKHSASALEVGSDQAGVGVQQWEEDGSPNQLWKIEEVTP